MQDFDFLMEYIINIHTKNGDNQDVCASNNYSELFYTNQNKRT